MSTSTFPFLSLPRELRNEIYKHLLTGTYNNNDVPKRTDFQTTLSTRRRAVRTLPPQHRYPHPQLAILLVSKSIHEESKYILYRCGTFAFEVFKTYDMLNQRSLKETAYMQNVIIDVEVRDPVKITSHPRRSHWKNEVASEVISHFGAHSDSNMPRASCVVKIRLDALAYPLFDFRRIAKRFYDALGSLTGFRYVEVRITRASVRNTRRISRASEMGKYLKGKLGRMEEGIEEGCFCMIYHPQRG